MSLNVQPYKGSKDFFPEEKRLQNYIFSIFRKVVNEFGYEEYDTPLIEPIELYSAKSGEEIVNEQTYSFTDRGGREVAIRPEMTPSVSRLVASRRQELAYPLRWFSIPILWRYERPQKGRLREHRQLNVDLFGIETYLAELEMVLISDRLLKAFGADSTMYEIRINHRQLLDELFFNYLNLDANQSYKVAKVIDKKNKIKRNEFIDLIDNILNVKQRENGVLEKLLIVLSAKNIDDLPSDLNKTDSVKDIRSLISACHIHGIKNIKFDIGIVRGFDYYSGLVFELFDTSPDNNRSMMGGGRYDGLVGLFGVKTIPTVGFGLGDATLANFLEIHNLTPSLPSETDIYIAVIDQEFDAAINLANKLRDETIKVAIDFTNRKLGYQIKTAEKKAIKYVLIIGPEESKTQNFTLRDITNSKEDKLSINQLISLFSK